MASDEAICSGVTVSVVRYNNANMVPNSNNYNSYYSNPFGFGFGAFGGEDINEYEHVLYADRAMDIMTLFEEEKDA